MDKTQVSKSKAQPNTKSLNLNLIIGVLGFIWILSFGVWDFASAASCVATLPTDARLRVADASYVTLDGSLVVDLGCFADHSGYDFEIYEWGQTEGGEVYVSATKDAPLSKWRKIPAAVPPHRQNESFQICDGDESLPRSTEGCLSGDEWLALDIGEGDGARYRYLRIEGAGADIDAVRVTPPPWSVELVSAQNAKGDALEAAPGEKVRLRGVVYGEGEGGEYTFVCGSEERSGKFAAARGDSRVVTISDLECSQGVAGEALGKLTAVSGGEEKSDTINIYFTYGGPEDESLLERAQAAAARNMKPLIIAIFIAIFAYFVHKWARHSNV